jgi:hypothetical protein
MSLHFIINVKQERDTLSLCVHVLFVKCKVNVNLASLLFFGFKEELIYHLFTIVVIQYAIMHVTDDAQNK